DAAVKFSRSVIMDEYDLSAQKMVEMHKCLTKSCKIYVSAPESSYESLDNINCGESTLGAMARAVDLITGEKVPYFMERYSAKAFMKNLNANHTCDPVVVYIVREGASMYNSARVFEAKQAALNIHWTNEETITLLSAEPFTVSANMDGGSLNGSIYTTGYDNILGNEDHCAPVYEFSKGNAFKFSVTGPIATLYRESFGEVELTVTNKFEVITDSPTLITSNGYIGCRNGKSYQSSLYDPLVSYHLAYDKAYYVHISAYLNTLNDFVTIKVDGEEAASIKGAVGRLNWNQTLDVHGKEIDIRFEGTKPQFSSFLLRLWTGEEPVTYQTTSRRFTFSTKPFTGTTKSSQVETTSVRTSTRDVTTTSTSSAVTSFMFV
ncbi:hypothetical protein PENTCL1PPCAC_21390, partial [Pristionchus entomophagus]